MESSIESDIQVRIARIENIAQVLLSYLLADGDVNLFSWVSDAVDALVDGADHPVLSRPYLNALLRVLNAHESSQFYHPVVDAMGATGLDTVNKGASNSAIEKLRKARVEGDKLSSSDDCAVYLNMLRGECVVTQMPCMHMFHEECLSKWLENHDTCPTCRQRV